MTDAAEPPEEHDIYATAINQLANAFGRDIEQLHIVLFKLLFDLGRIHEEDCPTCGFHMVIPIFENDPFPIECIKCANSPTETLDKWAETEEE